MLLKSSKQFFQLKHGYVRADQPRIFFAANVNESKAGKSWDGKHETLGVAPSAKHMLKRGQTHNDAATKKACNVVQFACSKAYGKDTPLFHAKTPLFHFCFTFHFWFSTAIFAKKNHPAENLKILNFCPWIPGIFLCNFQPLLPSWPMDPDPVLHCK